MGVLKVRSGSSWIDVGVGGGPLPPGGVLGDVLVKQSATNSDALWGTAMPKLRLTSPDVVTLAGDLNPLTLGTIAATNLAMYSTGMQARNNGVASTLRLNYYGGDVAIGNDQPVKVYIGNDAYLTDVNVAHTLGIVSASDSTWGKLRLGPTVLLTGSSTYYQLSSSSLGYYDANTHYFRSSPGADYVSIGAGPTIGFPGGNKIDVSGTELRMWGGATLTGFGNTLSWLNSAGSGWKMRHDANGYFEVWGPNSTFHHSVYSDNEFYSGTNCWFRVRGSGTGLYWESFGGGWHCNDSVSEGLRLQDHLLQRVGWERLLQPAVLQ